MLLFLCIHPEMNVHVLASYANGEVLNGKAAAPCWSRSVLQVLCDSKCVLLVIPSLSYFGLFSACCMPLSLLCCREFSLRYYVT